MLLKNKAKLATILKYHVVPGRVKSADVAGKSLQVKTAAGLPVNVDGTFGVRVNDAHVIQPDIEASNGVIHVIDTVLLPPAPGQEKPYIEGLLRQIKPPRQPGRYRPGCRRRERPVVLAFLPSPLVGEGGSLTRSGETDEGYVSASHTR